MLIFEVSVLIFIVSVDIIFWPESEVIVEVESDENFEIPLWQQESVLNRLKDVQSNPEKLVRWGDAKKALMDIIR